MVKCIDVLYRPTGAGYTFAMYVSEQLKILDKRWRLLAEKRIKEILFELRFEGCIWRTPDGGHLAEGCILISILFIPSPFTQCTMFQFSLPQAMKIMFLNDNHSLEDKPRYCMNFKALYLIFLTLCFCLKVPKMHSKIVLNKNSQKLSLSVSSCLVPLPFYTSLIYEILSEDFANNFSVFGGFSPNLWYNRRRKNSKRSFSFWSPTSLYQFALRIHRIS